MRQLGVVLIGASIHDFWHEMDDPRFAASAKAFRQLIAGGAVAPPDALQILDLYDSPASPDELIGQIVEFVVGAGLHDLIVYYCGHGFMSADRKGYCVALRRTRELTKTSSSLAVRNLAHDLDEHLIGKRSFFVFDSCFAGEAVKEFMAPEAADAFVGAQVMELFPRSGTAVVYATRATEVALSRQQDTMTLFTGTLIDVLRSGMASRSDMRRLSWRDAVEQVRRLTNERLGLQAPKPSIKSTKGEDGDITAMPFFRNAAYAPPEPTLTVEPLTAEPVSRTGGPLVRLEDRGAHAPVPPPRRAMAYALGAVAAVLLLGGTFLLLDQRLSQRWDQLREEMAKGGAGAAGRTASGPASPEKDTAEPAVYTGQPAVDVERQRSAEAAEQQRLADLRRQADAEQARQQALAAAETARLAEAERGRQQAQAQALAQAQAQAQAQAAATAAAEAARQREIAQAEANRVQAERVAQADLCDQLAANPYDASKAANVPGVSYQLVRGRAKDALAACADAAKFFPDFPRFRYQLARATQATNPAQAFTLQADLVRQNYPAAFDNYGWLNIQLRKDYGAAVAAFRRGAQLGDADSMVSLAQMIEEQRFTPQTQQEAKVELYRRAAEAGHGGAGNAYQIALREQQEQAASAAAASAAMGAVLGIISGAASAKRR